MATVTVSGRGEREVVPSRAVVHARLTVAARDRESAMAELAAAQARLVDALDEAPVFEQVRTWSTEERRRGHHATVIVRCEVEDTDTVGAVVAQLAGGDADVSWIDWQVADDDPVHADVRSDAVREAQAAARDYAAALGATLGAVVSVTDGTADAPTQPVMRAMAAGGPARMGGGQPELDLEPPTVRVSARAVLTQELVDGGAS